MIQAGPELADIHLPPEPSWWPPAPGWWLLAALLCVLLAVLTRLIRRSSRRRRIRQLVENQLAAISSRGESDRDAASQLAEVSVVLRRLVRLTAPGAATLQGEAWLRFLDGTATDRPFSEGPGRMLLDAPYRREVPRRDVDELIVLLRRRLPELLDARDV